MAAVAVVMVTGAVVGRGLVSDRTMIVLVVMAMGLAMPVAVVMLVGRLGFAGGHHPIGFK